MLFKTEVLERKTLDFALEVKEIGEDGTFSGYGAVFGNEDSYNEIILPGAFKKSLKKKMPVMLWMHRSEHPIGVFTLVKEDDHGLWVEGKLLLKSDVPEADKAYALLKNKIITGMSIGFSCTVWEWDENKNVRYLKEIDLWEVSLVTFPANELARVSSVKSLAEIRPEDLIDRRKLEAFLRDAGASKKTAEFICANWQEPARSDPGGDSHAQSKAFDDAIDRAMKVLTN